MDWDRAYQNGPFIPGSETFADELARDAAAYRAFCGGRLRADLPYGPGARQQFDLILPEGAARGLMVFVHGGYWLAFGRQSWSHYAAGALARGWAVALPSYTLAPEARIAQMTQEIAAAVQAAAGLVAGPVVVTGHSAGGHLSARMGCADIDLPRLARVVPISPLADLETLTLTAMNDKLHLDAAEVASESPCRLPRRAGVDAHVWVGGNERPAFLWQARILAEDWACRWTVAPGHHHFSVIDDLRDPSSALMAALLDGL